MLKEDVRRSDFLSENPPLRNFLGFDEKKIRKFILTQFTDIFDGDIRGDILYSYYLCATDTENVRHASGALKDCIFQLPEGCFECGEIV